jgi:hypothetical protein
MATTTTGGNEVHTIINHLAPQDHRRRHHLSYHPIPCPWSYRILNQTPYPDQYLAPVSLEA